jgi:hypothetical protein
MADESQAVRVLMVVPAAEILAKIEKGEPVEYDHAIIEGDLVQDQLDLPVVHIDRTLYEVAVLKLPEVVKIINSPISIQNSEINGCVNLNCVFHSSVSFIGTKFYKYIDFKGTQFRDTANFRGTQIKGDAAFCGAKFNKSTSFMGTQFNRHAYFRNTVFDSDALFGGDGTISGARFGYCADFKSAIFKGEAYFVLARFEMDAYFTEGVCFNKKANFRSSSFQFESYFNQAKFEGEAFFDEKANFVEDAFFSDARFNSDAHFLEVNFFRDANFVNTTFNGNVYMGMNIHRRKSKFYGAANFRNAFFNKGVYLKGADFLGNVVSLSFRGAKFMHPLSQESVCRLAKKISETNGNKKEADYHFYREMEAERTQKPWHMRLPEYVFIQRIFGYGVHPLWLWSWWFFFVGVFAICYWIGKGVIGAVQPLDYIWFSITVAVTPGFAGYKPTPGLFQVVAGLEAILGTFMWAAFIATFARKYMR